jgi:hypothetical protein
MQKGNSARRFISIGVALIALVALTVSLGAGAASAGPGHAVTAKKKCKKAKKGAVSAKKKRCKHKKQAPVVAPPATTTPAPPSGPTTRASITWDTSDEVDLHVFDASGNHDYYNGSTSTIPDAVDHDQSVDGGPETFVDSRSPSTRTFTFYVCLYGYQVIAQTSGPVHVTANIIDPGGGHRSIPITLDGINDEALVTVSPVGQTAVLASNFCHPVMGP